jgi:acid phosphatase
MKERGMRTTVIWHRCAVPLAFVACAAVSAAANTRIPKPDHVVIVMEENHGFSQIIGSPKAPYINSLAAAGALFTDSHAIEHPSQPNYLDLFSGSNQGVTDDSCPHSFDTDNEGHQLIKAGFSFAGFSEGLPGKGSEVCTAGTYARKHAPWTNFTDLPARTNLPFTKFAKDFKNLALPTVSWVIPDLDDDMHNGTIAQGDTWLQDNLSAYVTWAQSHNSLLIVTWDEDERTEGNHIATIFVGPMVKPGQYGETINHYTVLRTIEAMYGLPALGNAAGVKPIKDAWQ